MTSMVLATPERPDREGIIIGTSPSSGLKLLSQLCSPRRRHREDAKALPKNPNTAQDLTPPPAQDLTPPFNSRQPKVATVRSLSAPPPSIPLDLGSDKFAAQNLAGAAVTSVKKQPKQRKSAAKPKKAAKGKVGENGKPYVSRKEKSLGLLSEKFLNMYTRSTTADICLDTVASELGVERRRIYDIVNVLEGLELICRKAKNCYVWLGYTRLEATLAKFKKFAPSQIGEVNTEASDGASSSPAAPVKEEMAEEGRPLTPTTPTVLPIGTLGTSGCRPVLDANGIAVGWGPRSTSVRAERSLGILAQRFVMMLLMSQENFVTLEHAVEVLIFSGCSSDPKHKTKVRRLYDIANVLCSLNLIEKVTVKDGRMKKPAFRWLGLNVERGEPAAESAQRLETQSAPPVTEGAQSRKRSRKQSLFEPAQCEVESASRRVRGNAFGAPRGFAVGLEGLSPASAGGHGSSPTAMQTRTFVGPPTSQPPAVVNPDYSPPHQAPGTSPPSSGDRNLPQATLESPQNYTVTLEPPRAEVRPSGAQGPPLTYRPHGMSGMHPGSMVAAGMPPPSGHFRAPYAPQWRNPHDSHAAPHMMAAEALLSAASAQHAQQRIEDGADGNGIH